MASVQWERYPLVAAMPLAREWVVSCHNRALAPNTVDAYARDLEYFLAYLKTDPVIDGDPVLADNYALTRYVGHMQGRKDGQVIELKSGSSVKLATMRRRVSSVRVFFDHLHNTGRIVAHPLPRRGWQNSMPPGGREGATSRDLVPKHQPPPWIPNDEQWLAILHAAREASPRDRVMFALAYEGALRREEVVQLESTDFDWALRVITVRAEISKSNRMRRVAYTPPTGKVLMEFLHAEPDHRDGSHRLFRSTSNNSRGRPIGVRSFNHIIDGIASRAKIPQLHPHTLRHHRLTHLARADWPLEDIQDYAGHRDVETTRIYIHLSGADLARKMARKNALLERQMEQIAAMLAGPSTDPRASCNGAPSTASDATAAGAPA